EDIHDVLFFDAQTGFAVGAGGTILATTDGGQSWSAQSAGTTARLEAVAFTDTQRGLAVGQGAGSLSDPLSQLFCTSR
ncbi:MAG: hypothetical protein GY788_01965, partial [bacterium]|nr:hypothetical protein [bacterium]